MENNFVLYDMINTNAVRWLMNYGKREKKPLCIVDVKYKYPVNKWMLEMLKNYSLFNSYCNYYMKGNFFVYLYLRFIKRYNHLRFCLNDKRVAMIDTYKFVRELIRSCGEKVNEDEIILAIYNAYYRR